MIATSTSLVGVLRTITAREGKCSCQDCSFPYVPGVLFTSCIFTPGIFLFLILIVHFEQMPVC